MESLRQTAVIPLGDETQIAAARRKAAALCRQMGLSNEAAARAELVTVELAGNILQHAGRGAILLGPAGAVGGDAALQLIAADSGQGIGSLERAMQDGFSTSTTPGHGLGAVRRHVERMDVFSQPGGGTVVSAVVADGAKLHDDLAVITTSLDEDPLNGDGWGHFQAGGRTLYIIADGLGHGLYASEASAMALSITSRVLAENSQIGLTALLQRMHGPMHATRGAAVQLCSVQDGIATFAGVGNVSTMLHTASGETKGVLSHNGTVGHQMRRVQEVTLPAAEALLVMHSDGLSTRWKMSAYPGLQGHAPATIAGVLYRDAVRGRDDATVLVARLGQEPGSALRQRPGGLHGKA